MSDLRGHAKEIEPFPVTGPDGAQVQFAHDEHCRPGTTLEALAGLRTVFKADGVIHAGNSSGIVDGAAAVLVASERAAKVAGLPCRARIVSTAVAGSDPVLMLTGPTPSTRKALARAGLSVKDIDLWESNEAFAPVPMVVAQELGIPPRQGERQRRCHCAGAPAGGHGRHAAGHAARRVGAAGFALRRRHPVHRLRHGRHHPHRPEGGLTRPAVSATASRPSPLGAVMVVLRRFVVAVSAVLLLGAAAPSASARSAFARGEAAMSAGRLDEAAPLPATATVTAPAQPAAPTRTVDAPAPVPESLPTSGGAGGEPVRTPNPALAASRIRDGDALIKERRYREAAFAFMDASHADAGHVEALFKLGNAMAVLGYYGQAVEKWERAATLTEDAAIRQSAQDNVARARTKMVQAGASPQAAGQLPGSGPVADTTRAQARRAYEQGVRRIGSRDYGGAFTSLTQAIQLEPMLAVAYTARGSANIGLRRYAEAAADYQYAMELEPSSASPLYGLAESYRALGRNAEARGFYERYASSSAADVRSQLQEESRQKAAKLR